MSHKSDNVISSFIYIITIDNTVYPTTYVSFEGSNVVFSTFDDETGSVVNKTLNMSYIDSIRSTI